MEQSNPRLVWIMFNRIVYMYCAVKKQEALCTQSLVVSAGDIDMIQKKLDLLTMQT